MANVQVTANGQILEGNRVLIRSPTGIPYIAVNNGGTIDIYRGEDSDGNPHVYPTQFTAIDTAGRPTIDTDNVGICAAIKKVGIISIAYYFLDSAAMQADPEVKYGEFNTLDADASVDTWTLVNEQVANLDNSGGDFGFSKAIAIAIDGNDDPHVVWNDETSDMGSDIPNVYYSVKPVTTWNTRVSVNILPVNDQFTSLDIIIAQPTNSVGADRPIIAMLEKFLVIDNEISVYHGTALNATSFTSADDVTPANIPDGTSSVSIAIESSNDIWLAFTEQTTNNLMIVEHEAIEANWTLWEPPETVDFANNYLNPSLSINGTDRYILAEDSTTNDIELHASINGASWTSEGTLETGTFDFVKVKWAQYNDFFSHGHKYYFDGNILIEDPDGVWTNDANAGDGDNTTDASITNITVGSKNVREIRLKGTNAPRVGKTIKRVYFRAFGDAGDTGVLTTEIDTEGQAQELGTVNNSITEDWTTWTLLTVPTGGWTWDKISKLESSSFRDISPTGTATLARVDLLVETEADEEIDYAFEDGAAVRYNNFKFLVRYARHKEVDETTGTGFVRVTADPHRYGQRFTPAKEFTMIALRVRISFGATEPTTGTVQARIWTNAEAGDNFENILARSKEAFNLSALNDGDDIIFSFAPTTLKTTTEYVIGVIFQGHDQGVGLRETGSDQIPGIRTRREAAASWVDALSNEDVNHTIFAEGEILELVEGAIAVVTGAAGIVKVNDEILDLPEARNFIRGRIKINPEILDLSEGTIITRALIRLKAEILDLPEAANPLRFFVKLGPEILDLAEGALNILGIVKEKGEILDLPETPVKLGQILKINPEILDLPEGTVFTRALIRLDAEILDLPEAANPLRPLIRVEDEILDLPEGSLAHRARVFLKSEILDLVEGALNVLGIVKIKDEVLELVESALAVLGIVKEKGEILDLLEARNFTKEVIIVNDEALELVEGTIFTRALVRLKAEILDLVEAANNVVAKIKVNAEILDLSEGSVAHRGRVFIANEILDIPEDALSVLGIVKVDNETLNLVEGELSILGIVKVSDEILDLPEAANPLRAIIRVNPEILDMPEGTVKTQALIRLDAEILDIPEGSVAHRARIFIGNEILDLPEAANPLRPLIRVKDEILDLVEGAIAVVSVAGIVKIASEILDLPEARNFTRALIKLKSEVLDLSEGTVITRALVKLKAEILRLAEGSVITRALVKLKAEILDLVETEFAFPSIRIKTIDAVLNVDEDDTASLGVDLAIDANLNVNLDDENELSP